MSLQTVKWIKLWRGKHAHSSKIRGRGLKPSGFGEIYAKAIAASLILTGHLRARVAKLLLNVALIDLGRRGEASAQGMAGKKFRTLRLAKITSHTCSQRSTLYQACNFLVMKPVSPNVFVLP